MTTRHSKKRKYFRKCGFCGSRHEQSDMVRTDHSPNGWICRECLEDDEEPDLDGLVTTVELEPCPFCGGSDIGINRRVETNYVLRNGKAKISTDSKLWQIKCRDCPCGTYYGFYLVDVIRAWNRRAGDGSLL